MNEKEKNTQPENKEDLEPTFHQKTDPKIELTSTRILKPDETLVLDSTKTGIRIQPPVKNEDEEKENTTAHGEDTQKERKSFLRGKAPQKKSGGTPAFLKKWIEAPQGSFLEKTGFYFLNLIFLLLGLGLNTFFVFNALDLSHLLVPQKYFILALPACGIFLSLLSLMTKRSPAWFGGWPVLLLIGALGAQSYFLETSDPFLMVSFPVTSLLRWDFFWLGSFLLLFLIVLFAFPKNLGLKIFLLLVLAYGGGGFALDIFYERPVLHFFQMYWFFQKLPLLARPFYVFWEWVLPVFFAIFLFSLPFLRKKPGASFAGFAALFLLGLSVLGWFTLHNARIATGLNYVLGYPSGVGLYEAESGGADLRLATKNQGFKKESDSLLWYKMEMAPYLETSKKGGENKKRFWVWVYNKDLPVPFLSSSDFEFSYSETPVAQFEMSGVLPDSPILKNIKSEKKPNYLLSFKEPPLKPQFEVEWPKGPVKEGEAISVTIKKRGEGNPEYTFSVDGVVIETKKVPNTKAFKFSVPALETGKHVFSMTMKNESGESVATQELAVSDSGFFVVAQPTEGDFFDKTLFLSVVMNSPQKANVHFFMDGKEVAIRSKMPFEVSLDTNSVIPGPHVVAIEIYPEKGPKISRSISVNKGEVFPFSISSPYLGEYVPAQTKVEVDAGSFAGPVTLYVDDRELYTWNSAPYEFLWSTSGLSKGWHVLKAVAKVEGDVQVSHSVPVKKGEGQFRFSGSATNLVGDKKGKKTAELESSFNPVVFVVDATASFSAGFGGDTKWGWVQKLFRPRSLVSKLKGFEMGLVVFGSHSSSVKGNCEDAQLLGPIKTYDTKDLALKTESPGLNGLAAIPKAIELAMAQKPKKIILITDGGSPCEREILTDGVPVDVVYMGSHPDGESFLKKLAQKSGGLFEIIRQGSELEGVLEKFLLPRYQWVMDGKVVLEGVIGEEAGVLSPGTYTLRLMTNLPYAEKEIKIYNGLSCEIVLDKKDGKTESFETYTILSNPP